MKLQSILVLASLLMVGSLSAAEEEDAAMVALKRMREQLRTVMVQQQKTETDRATLEAEKTELQGKFDKLDASFKKLAKDSNADKEAAEKSIAELNAKILGQERDIAKLQESLAAWKKGHQEVVDAAKKIDSQRQELAARVILLDRKVADHQRKNTELFNLGTEVLSKLEGFGFGTALAAREPFTRNMRVKLETYLQDYGDKLADNKIQPDDAPKKASKAAPAAPVAEKPASKEEAARVQEPVKK